MRVLQGGHDVPTAKLRARYPRTMRNLKRAVRELPHVLVFDNSDLARPFRKVAEFERGKMVERRPRFRAGCRAEGESRDAGGGPDQRRRR